MKGYVDGYKEGTLLPQGGSTGGDAGVRLTLLYLQADSIPAS